MAKKEANLLVTFEPTHKSSALQEIQNLLKELKEKPEIISADEGLAEVLVKDAKKAVKALSALAKKSVDKFAYTFNWTPIDVWCKATVEDMHKEIKKFVKDIKDSDKWKMEVKTRKVKTKTDELKLTLKLTEVVDKPKVDLNSPDKIIKVEIIGNKAGLALLDKEELLNIAKLKQK